jgi:hypothetical protein
VVMFHIPTLCVHYFDSHDSLGDNHGMHIIMLGMMKVTIPLWKPRSYYLESIGEGFMS